MLAVAGKVAIAFAGAVESDRAARESAALQHVLRCAAEVPIAEAAYTALVGALAVSQPAFRAPARRAVIHAVLD